MTEGNGKRYELSDVLPEVCDYDANPELWESDEHGGMGLSELGAEVARNLGCTVDVDAYGFAFAVAGEEGE